MSTGEVQKVLEANIKAEIIQLMFILRNVVLRM